MATSEIGATEKWQSLQDLLNSTLIASSFGYQFTSSPLFAGKLFHSATVWVVSRLMTRNKGMSLLRPFIQMHQVQLAEDSLSSEVKLFTKLVVFFLITKCYHERTERVLTASTVSRRVFFRFCWESVKSCQTIED